MRMSPAARALLSLLCLFALVACGRPEATLPRVDAAKVLGRGDGHVPQGPFLWGVSTAGYQYEGNETTSDWAQWDLAGHTEERRGAAADGYNRYPEDLGLARGLGCNAFRTSVEWARIEPQEGQFDEAAIAHYRQMFQAMRAEGLTPVVTLMHFAYPAWLDRYGGWTNPKAVDAYVRFVDRVTHEYADLVDWYLTFNEPNVLLAGSFLNGAFPPGHKNDLIGAGKALKNMIVAHQKAYQAIHAADPVAYVSFNEYAASWQLGAPQTAGAGSEDFLNGVMGGTRALPCLDYMAIDYYTRLRAKLPFDLPKAWEWTVYPQGLYDALKHYHQITGLPVLIAENGMATDDGKPRADGWTREAYLGAHVEQMQRAVKDGIPVLGYIHWSITDNYEWGSYRPRFGLYAVDCRDNDQRRVPTQAASVFKQIIANQGVTPEINANIQYPTGYQPLVRP